MDKESTPLKALRMLEQVCLVANVADMSGEINIVETALKNYQELLKRPCVLVGRTNGHTKALIDMISKNYKEIKITNLDDDKKLKALEIIKEKRVNVDNFYRITSDTDYKEYKRLSGLYKITVFSNQVLTQEEFEILKEELL